MLIRFLRRAATGVGLLLLAVSIAGAQEAPKTLGDAFGAGESSEAAQILEDITGREPELRDDPRYASLLPTEEEYSRMD